MPEVMSAKIWSDASSNNFNVNLSVRKSKLHPNYKKVVSDNTVSALRQRARSVGTKKWYALRKASLASAIIIHDSAITVTKLFHENVNKKRLQLLESHVLAGSQCPISLTLVSELHEDDVFIHENIVFSREAILEYIKTSVDFLNPITRTTMHFHDIDRLGCQHALDKYRDRVTLRHRKVNSIRQFSFLETELENILISLVQQYYYKDTQVFYDTMRAFHDTWAEMKATDRNRTVCVLKSMVQSVYRFHGRPRIWGRTLVSKYLVKT